MPKPEMSWGLRGLGMWLKTPLLQGPEIAAACRLDLAIIDLEHSSLAVAEVDGLLAISRAANLRTLVRVASRGPEVQRVLDAAADGLVFPHVDTYEDAVDAVAASSFPPDGRRGMGPAGRAGRFGLAGKEAYIRDSSPLRIVQVESVEGVRHVERITAVPGIHGTLLGGADLAADARARGREGDVSALGARVRDATHAAGKVAGTAVAAEAAAVTDALSAGFDFVVAGNELSLLAASLTSLRQAVDRPPA